MEKLSVFVTTFNNEFTLEVCLESVKWADEVVVLDSFSTDGTLNIATRYGAKIFREAFKGYGKQKQSALEKTSYRWVLLLDADEALSLQLQQEIQQLLKSTPSCAGYELPRQEQIFWRMASTRSRLNGFLRLFDKTRGRVSEMAIHASPKVDGPVGRLAAPFYHYGETDIHVKVDKINSYSTGLVEEKRGSGVTDHPLTMIWYPPLFFLRLFILKRNFLNGWAGFIASGVGAFYVFLKYAKLFEARQQERLGQTQLPPGAPASIRKKSPV